MTLNDIFLRLRSIDCKAQSLISETGFDPSGTLGSQVRLEPGDPDWYERRKTGDAKLWRDDYYCIPFGFLRQPELVIEE